MVQNLPKLRQELETQVKARTGRRVQNLEFDLFPGRIILRGRASTYHIKQLAQHGVRDILPEIRLENAIVVG